MEANPAGKHPQNATFNFQSSDCQAYHPSKTQYGTHPVHSVDSVGRLLPVRLPSKSGYTQRHSRCISIPGRFQVHQWTKVDRRDIHKNSSYFSELVGQLAQELNISQTSVLESIVSATALIPYLRKIDRAKGARVSDKPSEIQAVLLAELTLRIGQYHTFHKLFQLLKNDVDRADITIDQEQETISVNQHSFHRDDLGNDRFRELCDRLKKCHNQPQLLSKMIGEIRSRGEKTIAYYYSDVIDKIMSVQSASIKEQIASALAIHNTSSLRLTSADKCNQFIQLIPTLQFTTHPGFTVMKPLVSKLVRGNLAEEILSSKNLNRQRISAEYALMTTLPTGQDQEHPTANLYAFKDRRLDPEDGSGIFNRLMEEQIESSTPEELSEAIKLFNSLFCDLTPLVSKEIRFGIVYTMNKFKHRKLLERLLLTISFGTRIDPFLTLYTTQLSLTYAVALNPSDLHEIEVKTNVVIKTLLLRMALCTTLIARGERITVKPDVLMRAQRLIAHHNQVLSEIQSEQDEISSMKDDFDDQVYINDISNYDYLRLPANLDSEDTVMVNPDLLILPVDKHFKTETKSLESGPRRAARAERDEIRIFHDFVLTSLSANLDTSLSQITEELPVSYLFSGEYNITHRQPGLIGELSQRYAEIPVSLKSDEQQLMATVSQLFILANKVGRCGVKISEELTRISESSFVFEPLISRLSESIRDLPANHDRRDVIEYVACLLIYEFKAPQCSLKHLVKLIYVIQSRAECLQFGDGCSTGHSSDSSKIKRLLLGQYFLKIWQQPDGCQGQRIRTILKQVFTTVEPRGYREIIELLLKSMRPPCVDEATYPAVIDSLYCQVENLLRQKNTLNDLSKKRDLKFNVSFEVAAYGMRIAPSVETLANSLNSLLDQVLQNTSTKNKKVAELFNSGESGVAGHGGHAPVSPVLFGQQSSKKREFSEAFPDDNVDYQRKKPTVLSWTEHNAESYSYVSKQVTRLAKSFVVWVRGSYKDSGCEISPYLETTLQKIEKILMELSPVCTGSLNESVMLSVTRALVEVGEKFKSTQRLHSGMASSIDLCETYKRFLHIQSMSEMLEQHHEPLPEPEELQQSIEQHITPSNFVPLTSGQQQAIAIIKAFKVPNNRLLKALLHPEVFICSQRPEYLENRIKECQALYDGFARALCEKYRHLKSKHNAQLRDEVLTNPGEVKKKKILDAQEAHAKALASYKTMQRECQLHWLQSQNYQNGFQRFEKLQEIPFIHTVQFSGISPDSLSEHQKTQLSSVFSGFHPTAEGMGDNIFDLINADSGRKKKTLTIQSDKEVEQAEIINSYKFRGKKNADSVSLESYAEAQKEKIRRQSDDVAKLTENYSMMELSDKQEKDKIKDLTISIEKILGEKKDAKIVINGQQYSYLDAFVAFCHVKNDIFCIHPSAIQREIERSIKSLVYKKASMEKDITRDHEMLMIAKVCKEKGIVPDVLPGICKLMELEFPDNVEQLISEAEVSIKKNDEQREENLSAINAHMKPIIEQHRKEIDDVKEDAEHSKNELFKMAFESNQCLNELHSLQSMLCDHMLKGGAKIERDDPLISDCLQRLDLKIKNHTDIIDLPTSSKYDESRLAANSLIFTLLNCKGTHPLLEPLYARKLIRLHSLFHRTFGPSGNWIVKSNALILSAAKGHYQSCGALIGILKKEFNSNPAADIDLLQLLLTKCPVADNRNLLHHLAKSAQPEVLEALLELISDTSGRQQYDPDYPLECLQNQVALNKGLLLQELLTQTDCEGLLPSDLLLFNIGRRIREWPQQNEQALNGFYEKFLINEFKSMWKLAAESLTVEQLHKTIECFMKGIQDLSQLPEAKQQVAKEFLQKFIRIFRVHGPGELHDQLTKLLAPAVAQDRSMDLS